MWIFTAVDRVLLHWTNYLFVTAERVKYLLHIFVIWGMLDQFVFCVATSVLLVRPSHCSNESHVVGGLTDLKWLSWGSVWKARQILQHTRNQEFDFNIKSLTPNIRHSTSCRLIGCQQQVSEVWFGAGNQHVQLNFAEAATYGFMLLIHHWLV